VGLGRGAPVLRKGRERKAQLARAVAMLAASFRKPAASRDTHRRNKGLRLLKFKQPFGAGAGWRASRGEGNGVYAGKGRPVWTERGPSTSNEG
jgi:hypothetical protein